MNLANEFASEVKLLWPRHCMVCGRSDQPLEDHHIYGRVSSSPLNGIRVCKECHDSKSFMDSNELLDTSIKFWSQQGYSLIENDWNFLKRFKLYK